MISRSERNPKSSILNNHPVANYKITAHMYFYIKALHIIFIVTWFSGMFYIVRLFIYNTEAQEKEDVEKRILSNQFSIMIKRLWLGIAWPSAILTIIFGGWVAYLYGSVPTWLWIKLSLVAGLYAYHFTLHKIYKDESKGIFSYTSQQLRFWNEGATIFLFSIVMLVSVKQSMSLVWGLAGLTAFILILLAAIRIYKGLRR
jgi:putative membrane protein